MDIIITRLQSQTFVIISDFKYNIDRNCNPYGWGIAEYSSPENFYGDEFSEKTYKRTPEESYERIFEHFTKLFSKTDENTIKKFIK